MDGRKIEEWRGQVIDPIGRVLDMQTLTPIIQRLPKPLLIPTTSTSSSSSNDSHDEPTTLPCLTYPPPPLASRSTSHRFLPTGFVHIDSFHPLAEGLRIGIMGSKRTGKTAMAAAILGSFAHQQKEEFDQSKGDETQIPNTPPTFIYVSVGQSKADVRALLDRLQRNGALAHTIVVAATHESGMGLQYLAPFFGQTISDYLRSQGEDSMVLFDDLSAHGQVLTTINRVMGQQILAPNFVHARLLERTAPIQNGASNTALVLVETGRQDRTVDVNENLSGFVDHAIWLDPSLAGAGVFPAINVSSVLGRPSARYRPHVLRTMSNNLSKQLLHSDRLNNMSKWANEFGLEVEEDDRHVLEFKDKVQIILSQRLDEPRYNVSEQLILLRALQKDEGDFLARISKENAFNFKSELIRTLKDRTIEEHVELFDDLKMEVENRLKEFGNSTQGAGPLDSKMMMVGHEGPHPNTTGISERETLQVEKLSELRTRVDQMLERFMEQFVLKYER